MKSKEEQKLEIERFLDRLEEKYFQRDLWEPQQNRWRSGSDTNTPVMHQNLINTAETHIQGRPILQDFYKNRPIEPVTVYRPDSTGTLVPVETLVFTDLTVYKVQPLDDQETLLSEEDLRLLQKDLDN